jgi:MYXO-CTERM domain-containing protein
MTRFLSTALILCLAAPAWAAAPERLGAELSVGDNPSHTTVLAGDRVAAALVGETRVIAWRDAADYTEEPALIAPTGEARALTAAGSSDAPVLVIAGSALELLTFDTTTVPATSSSTASISLEGDEGSLAAVVWSSNHDTVYAIDDVVPRLHAFGLIDETALTPVELDFTPTGLALVDSELIVVIGADEAGPRLMGIALDGTGVPGDTTDVDLTGLIDTSVEAIAADGAGTGWLIATNDAYHLFVEIVRDDTERSAPRGCAPVDGTANRFAFRTLSCELAAGAATLTYGVTTDDEAEDEPGVYIGGGGFLSYVDVSVGSTYDVQSLDLMLTGTSGDIALSSSTDSYLYVAQPETGLLGVVVPGPWLDLDAPDTNLSGNADTLTFSITPTLESLQSCSFTVHQGGDFTGTGVVIESGSGVAPSGDATEVSIPALDLEDGSARLFILCGDDDGVFGRASLSYYKGGLEAPEITALPGSENVVVSFDGLDDDTITHYLVYFDTWDFGATGTAAGVNSTSTISSPIQLDSDSGTVTTGDDDDSADDGSEGRDDTDTLTYSTSITDLVNETPYYFAVSAVDSDGNEGPRSTVVEARPGVTGGAAALASDTYGCSCQTVDSGATPVGLAALFALLGLGRYRRRMDPLYR